MFDIVGDMLLLRHWHIQIRTVFTMQSALSVLLLLHAMVDLLKRLYSIPIAIFFLFLEHFIILFYYVAFFDDSFVLTLLYLLYLFSSVFAK